MKKNGFTLIELIAVLAILAIITLIVTPTVINYIEKVKEDAAVVSATNYITAVDNAFSLEGLKK